MRRCFGEYVVAYSDFRFASLSVIHSNGGNLMFSSDLVDIVLLLEAISEQQVAWIAGVQCVNKPAGKYNLTWTTCFRIARLVHLLQLIRHK
jgi:hypothetical protein